MINHPAKEKPLIKINSQNSIDSIIEFFHYFSPKYNIKIENLEDKILYKIHDINITQTYKNTLLLYDYKIIKEKITNTKKPLVIFVINEKCSDEKRLHDIIVEIHKIDDVIIKVIDEENIFSELNMICKEGICYGI